MIAERTIGHVPRSMFHVPRFVGGADRHKPADQIHQVAFESSLEADTETVRATYFELRAEAEVLAGRPDDIAQRAAIHHSIYRDSRGNHTFPQVALHGALWAYRFFETSGRLGDVLRHRYFYTRREREYRMGLLNQFAQGFKAVNRLVFVDTYTNYYFTQHFGHHPVAANLLHPDLLSALNGVHAARRSGTSLSATEKRHVYTQALLYEQELTVAPGVQAEIEKFDCPILRACCLKPVVHFAYFPRQTYFWFRNFADKKERIERAMRSQDLAEAAGWSTVVETMRDYAVLPDAFFHDRTGYIRDLKQSLLAKSLYA